MYFGQAYENLFLFQMWLVSSPGTDNEAVNSESSVCLWWLRIALHGT